MARKPLNLKPQCTKFTLFTQKENNNKREKTSLSFGSLSFFFLSIFADPYVT